MNCCPTIPVAPRMPTSIAIFFVPFVFKKKADLVLSSVGNVPLVMRLF